MELVAMAVEDQPVMFTLLKVFLTITSMSWTSFLLHEVADA